jgi:VanZ family protein
VLIIGWSLTVVAVVGGSLLPGSAPVVTALPSDYLMHFGAYALLALFPMLVLERSGRVVMAVLLTGLLGVALEYGQTMVPGRFLDSADIAANSLGLLCGVVAGLPGRRS